MTADTMSALGTLFPEYRSSGDGAPGDNDPGQNLGDFPFGEPISEKDPLASPGVQTTTTAAPAPYDTDDRAGDPSGAIKGKTSGDDDTPSRRRTASQRISQLTARYRQTEGERNELAAQVEQLASIVRAQNEQLSQLSQSPRRSNQPDNSTELDGILAGQTGGPQPVGNGLDAGAIQRIVQSAIAPLVQRVQAADARDSLKAEHEASFARAVQEFPELGKPNSEAVQVFAELYRTHPLRQLADGPEQLAYMVRGILADSRRQEQTSRSRKIAASGAAPVPSNTDILPPNEGAGDKKVADAAKENYRLGDHQYATYRAIRLGGRKPGG